MHKKFGLHSLKLARVLATTNFYLQSFWCPKWPRGKGKTYVCYKMLLLWLWWNFVPMRKSQAWCLLIILLFELSKFVLNTHWMNSEAFTFEYSPKFQFYFLRFEIWYDRLKLDILFLDLKKNFFNGMNVNVFPK